MWTRLATWLVQDGEVPELRVGDTFHQVALRAACWSIRDSEGPEGVVAFDGPGDDLVKYEVTGTVIAGRESNMVVMQVGSALHIVAEPHTHREVGDDGALEPYSPSFRVPRIGARSTVACTLEVMGDHESDFFTGLNISLDDIRRDWLVEGIKVAHEAPSTASQAGPADNGSGGAIVRTDEVDGMRRWADEAGALS